MYYKEFNDLKEQYLKAKEEKEFNDAINKKDFKKRMFLYFLIFFSVMGFFSFLMWAFINYL